jgi:hypothetical protein
MPNSSSAIEQLACRPDERPAAQVFLVAWLLADNDYPGTRRAFTEDRLRGRFPQIAPLAAHGRVAQCVEALVHRLGCAAFGNGTRARFARLFRSHAALS